MKLDNGYYLHPYTVLLIIIIIIITSSIMYASLPCFTRRSAVRLRKNSTAQQAFTYTPRAMNSTAPSTRTRTVVDLGTAIAEKLVPFYLSITAHNPPTIVLAIQQLYGLYPVQNIYYFLIIITIISDDTENQH